MSRPEPPPGGELLLHCNLERTLLLSRDPASGGMVVHKLLLRGSIADAEHECAIGQRLAHLDVVRYLGAGTDAASGRPCVRTQFHEGIDLDALVAERGTLPAAEACRVLAPVARTLAAMHALRTGDLPQGLCHGDVKPSNLLRTGCTTLVLDFEHAGPTHALACAGTAGFAAPEAEIGAPLHPSFDVFGLGATLHWLLTGTPTARERLRAEDQELQLLADACLARNPAARPTAAIVAEALAAIGTRLGTDAHEAARDALQAGDLDLCGRLLDQEPEAALQALLLRRRRLLQRRPDLFIKAAARVDDAADPAALAAHLGLLAAFLRRFPRHGKAIENRRASKRRAGQLLAATLPSVFDLVRAEEFDNANIRLADLRRLTRMALAQPGPLGVPGENGGRMPTLLQRAPLACLDQEQQRLDAAIAEHRDLLATLHAAEGALALDDASSAIDNIGSRYGGTSEAVARHRDRLHRLGFYVERIARARVNIERLYEAVPNEDPVPLLQLVDECAAAVARASPTDDLRAGSIGLRSLHLALGNLREEFPALRDRAAPGTACLDRALARVTDEAWHLIADAQQKLQAEPIPVRPLHLLLGRLDAFRTLEAFVDRPQHSRSTLVDRIEWLRLRLEQAQATRDRLAHGAEQALAKGHWTTGLFDMERAVTHLQTDDDLDDRQTRQLRQRLAEAKKRKQEIEIGQRRNHELQSRYRALQDDADSTTTDRLQVLREQRDCLQFLAVHAQKERSSLYASDLRDVELRIAQEQASQAETELDVADSPAVRQRIAAQALAQLEAFASTGEPGADLPGRLRRMIDHWRRRHDNEQRELERRLAETRARRRRRWLAAWAALALVVVTGTSLRMWSQSAQAGSRRPLLAAAQALAAPLREPAVLLADVVPGGIDATSEPATFLAAVEAGVHDFLSATNAQAADPARAEFARRVWLHALTVARGAAVPGAPTDLLEATAATATERLREAGMND